MLENVSRRTNFRHRELCQEKELGKLLLGTLKVLTEICLYWNFPRFSGTPWIHEKVSSYFLAGSSRPSIFWSLKKRRPGIKRTHRAGQNGPTKNLYDFSKVMNKCDKSWGWPRLLRDFTKPSQFDGFPRPRARLRVPNQIIWRHMIWFLNETQTGHFGQKGRHTHGK